MGKKKKWFSYVKKLFHFKSKPKSEESDEKPKKWRWFFQIFKSSEYPAIEEESRERTLNDATEEHLKRALTVAIATAAAAEAAVAAANAAAELVWLSQNQHLHTTKIEYFAAIKIQSAYRRHLARKALNALKGIVKLQAVVRGQLVRNRIVKRLAQVQEDRVLKLINYLKNGDQKRHCLIGPKEVIVSEEPKHQGYTSLKDWDFSMVPKESVETFHLRKHEAIAKRERTKQYSISNREGTELRLRTSLKNDIVENLHSPRRSLCHIKQKLTVEDESLPSSPVLPTYMAATESAKAKCRSLSTPRQRFRLLETYSGPNSPHKLSISSWRSFNGDTTIGSRRNSISKQISADLE